MAVEREDDWREKNAVKLLKIISEDYEEDMSNWAGLDYDNFRKQQHSHQDLPKPRNSLPNSERQKKLGTIFRKRSDKKSAAPPELCTSYCKQYKSFTLANEENSSQNYLSQTKRQSRSKKLLKVNTCTKLHAEQTISKISLGQEVSSQLRTTGSQQYILKITKFSSRNKKQQNQSTNQKSNLHYSIQKIENLSARVTDKYKNKIKKKISHKFLLRKIPRDKIKQLSKGNQQRNQSKKHQEKPEDQRPQKINLLQNWLDSNRYRRRKSVACLLKELFQNKSHEKQRKVSNQLFIQSTRLVSLASDQRKANQ